jgi:hypothetical protein
MLPGVMRSHTLARVIASVAAAAIAVGLVLWSGRDHGPPLDQTPMPDAHQQVAECAHRLTKLGKALRMYADDNKDAFPIGETPAAADQWLPPLLARYGVTEADFRCPTAEPAGPAYVYHCYKALDDASWPRWMAEKHFVTLKSPPGTWLAADYIRRDGNGPHSQTDKAFNYLTVDGRVKLQVGRPRDVYK